MTRDVVRRRLVTLVAVLALAVGACVDNDPEPDPTAAPTGPATTNASPASPAPSPQPSSKSSTTTDLPTTASPSPSPSTGSTPTPSPQASADRPNIVLVTTDDATVSDLEAMPLTRSLVGERGLTFTNSYSPYPWCCPARASILTGQYTHNHGVRRLRAPFGGVSEFADQDQETIATWLQDAGYGTGFVGKYLNEYGGAGPASDDPDNALMGIPPGWDDWRASLQGIYNYQRVIVNDNGQAVEHVGYQTDTTTDQAIDIITGLAGDEPFFTWVSYMAPHRGTRPGLLGTYDPEPAPRHADASVGPIPDTDATQQDTPLELLEADKAAFVQRRSRRLDRVGRTLPSGLEDLHEARVRSLLAVDEGVARLVDTLAELGELEDTLFVYTSDNGYMLGQFGLEGKPYPYTQATGVPLLMAGPGVPEDRTVEAMAATIDLAPTFAAAAGVEPGIEVDGVDLLGAVASGVDPAPEDDRALEIEAWLEPDGQLARSFHGLQTREWLYIEFPDLIGGGPPGLELYDLRVDPQQLDNLADDPANAGVVAQWGARLDVVAECVGEECRTPG